MSKTENEIDVKISTDLTLTRAKAILVERGYEAAHLRDEDQHLQPLDRVLNDGIRGYMHNLAHLIRREEEARRDLEVAVENTARRREDFNALLDSLPTLEGSSNG